MNASFASDGSSVEFDQLLSIGNAQTVTFGSGTYWFKGGLDVEGSAKVYFNGGTYILSNVDNSGGLALHIGNGAAVYTGSSSSSGGALLYVEAGPVTFDGGGNISLSPLSQYDGISIWDASTALLTLDNGSQTDALGGIYMPKGEIDFAGGPHTSASFIVASSAEVSGGANVSVGS